ncbi:MAG: hypothetical protein ABR915_18040 [Thermoguttaceae bacterium]|jgi:hypothetical protein
MLLFTRIGRLNLLQHPLDATSLQIHAQGQEDVDRLVAMLAEIGTEHHDVQPIHEGDYRFLIVARKAVVAEAIARLVAQIDYTEFMRAVHFDFGKESGFLLMVTPNGLEVARAKPE